MVNRLALGTVQFGINYGISNKVGQVSRKDAKAMLQLASYSGIDTLDTAIAYGDSETCLGEAGTQDFKVITKLPSLPENCSDVSAWVYQQVVASLSRLGLNNIYGLLLHRSEQLLSPNGSALYKTLQTLKDKGLVQKVGVSIYDPSELAALAPKFSFDLVQAPFNLIDRRIYLSGWLQRLKDSGVEIHTRSAFLQGLLLMTRNNIPKKFSPWDDLWDKWFRWQLEHNISASQACLAFPLSFQQIDRVVVGAESVNQLEQIVSNANVHLKNMAPFLQCDDEKLINPSIWDAL